MNRGLIIKAVREVWPATVLFGLALAGFEALLASIIPTIFAEYSSHLLKIEFVQTFLKGLLGTEIGSALGPDAISSFAWVHPIVLALLWAHEITICTRVPAGEVDRGTIDMLLALPVSRTKLYVCESVVWLGAGLCVVMMGLAGNWIGGRFTAPEFRSAPGQLIMVIANMYCLYIAVGGVACLVSTLSDHRGRAVGVVFGIVLVSFLLNFLAQFWGPAKALSFLSVLNYYRPLAIVRDAGWPVRDMLVLTACGAAFWLAGAIIFARRDICTN